MVAKGTHFDLVSGFVACRERLTKRGVFVEMVYVRGHMDRYGNHALSFLEKMNVLVDSKVAHDNKFVRYALK